MLRLHVKNSNLVSFNELVCSLGKNKGPGELSVPTQCGSDPDGENSEIFRVCVEENEWKQPSS